MWKRCGIMLPKLGKGMSMERKNMEPQRVSALAAQTEIGGGFLPRISRALRIAPLALCVSLGAVGAAFALDPVQNDFWDTTGYVNATPNVAESNAVASEFVSFIFNMKEAAPMESRFMSTKPLGFTLVVR